MVKYYVGVEGGSSASTIIVINELGSEVYNNVGPSTNPLLDGEEVIFDRIADMVREAKISLNWPLDEPLEAIGLCLSGCTDDATCDELADKFKQIYPKVSKICAVRNDIVGSVYTSNVESGVAIISGTGQNTILFESGRLIATCGGWGHYFADEGSGYWIAAKAYKTLLDDVDNFEKSPHDMSRLRKVILKHFNLTDERHIMSFYEKPDKKRVASLCKELYMETKRERDPAIDSVFEQAGYHLAKRVAALIPKADHIVIEKGLKIYCVGSVWTAWDLIECGFVKLLSRYLDKFYVYTLKSSSALGAAKFGAKLTGLEVNIQPNIQLLHEYNAPVGTTEHVHASEIVTN